MSIRTGLKAQLGIAAESTWGTYVAPTRFLEFVSESMAAEIQRLESVGLRAGQRVLRSDRWIPGRKTVAGDLTFETQTTGLGILFSNMFGGVATANPSAGVYEHTFTPGDLPIGMSVQVGKPSIDGTVRPFSYVGCRCASWSLSGTVDELGALTMSIVARDEDLGQSLGSPTYPSNDLLGFVEASVDLGGGPIPVRSFEINGDNGLVSDRGVLGSALHAEHLEGTGRTYDGTIDAHYVDLTDYNRFVNGTEATLLARFVGPEISGGLDSEILVTANVRSDGSTPVVSGPEEIPLNIPFKVIDPGGNTGISLMYRTSDATP